MKLEGKLENWVDISDNNTSDTIIKFTEKLVNLLLEKNLVEEKEIEKILEELA